MKTTIYKKTALVLTICLGLYLFSCPLGITDEAKQYDISLSEPIIQPGRQTRLTIIFSGKVDVPKPEIPDVSGLDIKYMGRSMETSGKIVHTFRIIALTEGEFTIGPIFSSFEGRKLDLGEVRLKVSKIGASSLDGEDDLSERIFIKVDLPKRSVYVNETIPVKIQFFSDWLDVENIVISDEPSKNYIAGEYLPGPTGITALNDTQYAVLEYKRDLFIPQEGSYTFGPVRAAFDIAKKKDTPLNNNEDFYNSLIGRSSSKKFKIETEVFDLNVLSVPKSGMPKEFTGAMGNFELISSCEYAEVLRSGDTFLVNAEIKGKGTLTKKTLPELTKLESFEILDKKVKISESGLLVSYKLRILKTPAKTLPDVIFVYFDPEKGEYVTLKRNGEEVNIEYDTESEDTPQAGSGAEIITSPIVEIKRSLDFPLKRDIFFYEEKWMSVLLILPIFFIAIAAAIKKRIDILNSDIPYARRIRASGKAVSQMNIARNLLKKGDVDAFYAAISNLLREYLSIRFLIPKKIISRQYFDAHIREILRDDVLSGQISEILEDECFARFSKLVFDKRDMIGSFRNLKNIISTLNRRKLQ